jgi:hypothetical protein
MPLISEHRKRPHVLGIPGKVNPKRLLETWQRQQQRRGVVA